MDDAERLEVAIRAARAGGQVALAHLGNPLYFKLKDRRDLLLGASIVVQDTIREVLLTACPDDAFLGEEGPDDEPLPVNADRLWIVDPIDGSINFFRGVPTFAISIGFRDANGFRVGVVFDPSRDELFSARFSDGARLNGERIYVHVAGEGEDAYEQSLIGTDLHGGTDERVLGLRAATHVGNRMLGLVMLGSPALGLCYVAAGRTHAYFHLKLHLWDVAAAAVILQESGAILPMAPAARGCTQTAATWPPTAGCTAACCACCAPPCPSSALPPPSREPAGASVRSDSGRCRLCRS